MAVCEIAVKISVFLSLEMQNLTGIRVREIWMLILSLCIICTTIQPGDHGKLFICWSPVSLQTYHWWAANVSRCSVMISSSDSIKQVLHISQCQFVTRSIVSHHVFYHTVVLIWVICSCSSGVMTRKYKHTEDCRYHQCGVWKQHRVCTEKSTSHTEDIMTLPIRTQLVFYRVLYDECQAYPIKRYKYVYAVITAEIHSVHMLSDLSAIYQRSISQHSHI